MSSSVFSLRSLLAVSAIATTAFGMAACTTILGDEFEIDDGGSDGSDGSDGSISTGSDGVCERRDSCESCACDNCEDTADDCLDDEDCLRCVFEDISYCEFTDPALAADFADCFFNTCGDECDSF